MYNVCRAALALAVTAVCAHADAPEFELEVLPAEHIVTHDPETGATLTFLTTSESSDVNLYFHERSWFSDSSIAVFYSHRTGDAETIDPETGVRRGSRELLGYVFATGELIVLKSPKGGLGGATCAKDRNSVFAMRDGEIIEFAVRVEISANPQANRSRAFATERVIGALPPGGVTSLNESCDGKHVSLGLSPRQGQGDPVIYIVDVQTGEGREVCRVPTPPKFMYHVQWSRSNPSLLSFAGDFPRLHVVDIRDGSIRSVYDQVPGELVTHEHWWGDDQIIFCGGLKQEPVEDSHVKVVDVHTGQVRILAAGSWWPEGTDEQVARRNYWHCAGSEDARWVAADSWHGDITIIEAKTCRPRVLTTGHRQYGRGEHPHVGWDRKGEQLIFCSHKLGNPNVCVATIPREWQEQSK